MFETCNPGHLPYEGSLPAPGLTAAHPAHVQKYPNQPKPPSNSMLCQTVADSDYLVDSITGLLNSSFIASTWCPAKSGDQPPAEYVLHFGLQFQ